MNLITWPEIGGIYYHNFIGENRQCLLFIIIFECLHTDAKSLTKVIALFDTHHSFNGYD